MKRKYEQKEVGFLDLNSDIYNQIARNLIDEENFETLDTSIKAAISLASVNCKLHQFFHLKDRPSILKDLKVYILLRCVVERNIIKLKRLVLLSPELFFEKGNVTAPRGQAYKQVSPYELMIFLCDNNMKQIIDPLVQQFYDIRKKQSIAMGKGGSDLVKLDYDPSALKMGEFCRFKKCADWYLIDGKRVEISIPLLQNQNGVLYFKDKQGEEHLYYADCIKEQITELKLQKQSKDLDSLKAHFANMGSLSACRSNDEQHKFITEELNCDITREGIRYSQDGVEYKDSCTPFHLIQAYRALLQSVFNPMIDFNTYAKNLGKRQGEEIWPLLLLCGGNQFMIKSIDLSFNFIFSNSKLAKELGNTTLMTSYNYSYGTAILVQNAKSHLKKIVFDLASLCHFIQEAKKNIACEFLPEPNQSMQTQVFCGLK